MEISVSKFEWQHFHICIGEPMIRQEGLKLSEQQSEHRGHHHCG